MARPPGPSVVTPNAVNELRFGWFKDRLSDPGASDLFPAETGATYITVAGSTVGAAQAYPRTYPSENRYQIVENYSWTKGAHSVKFGVDFQTTQDWMNQLFNAVRRLQLHQPAGLRQGFHRQHHGRQELLHLHPEVRQSDPEHPHHRHQLLRAGYLEALQTPHLQLRPALRKDLASAADHRQPGLPGHRRNQLARTRISRRAPASLIRSSDRTVLRAGYGIFYARFHGNALDTLFLGNGKYQTSISINNTQAGAPVFNGVLASAAGFPAGTVSLNVRRSRTSTRRTRSRARWPWITS